MFKNRMRSYDLFDFSLISKAIFNDYLEAIFSFFEANHQAFSGKAFPAGQQYLLFFKEKNKRILATIGAMGETIRFFVQFRPNFVDKKNSKIL